MSTELLPAESSRLAELKAIVSDGLNTFVAVGRALVEIRDSRLYRQTHGTFEAFCNDEWSLSRPRAYQLIEAATVTEAVSTSGGHAPTSERQARELTGLPAETAAEVMRTAHEQTAGKVTATAIKQARQEIAPKPERPDPWAERIASELAAADDSYREQATTPEPTRVLGTDGKTYTVQPKPQAPPEPSPAVTEWLEDSQAVKDSGYVREFTRTLARVDEFLLFDAERLANLLDENEAAAVVRFAASATRFAETVRRNRSGLRVINGGN
jgi:hypothetical protein